MGRWTVRTANSAKQTNGTADIWLYNSTRKDLIRYLNAYREMALSLALSRDEEDLALQDESARIQYLKAAEEKVDYYLKTDWTRDEPIWLADVEFPSLLSIAAEPYWIVQVDLSGRQRKVIHNACVETDLFHTTHDGCVVISVFADGLNALPGWNPPSVNDANSIVPTNQTLYMYKPWVCKNEKYSVDEESRAEGDETPTPVRSNSTSQQDVPLLSSRQRDEADEAIHLLIDHPSNCLREERDVLVYNDLYEADLTCAPDLTSTPFVYVDTVDKWKDCLKTLRNCHELAFDIEAFANQRYTQITCLIQFATDSGDEFVVDPLVPELWDRLQDDLAPVFADPTVVKIGHSISGLDARCLHRDFGCFIINAFDTYQAAKVLDLPSQGLASICSHYGLPSSHYSQLKAEYQTSDWRRRPLSKEQLDYARSDVRYLVLLRKLMMRDLVKNDFWDVVPQTDESMEQERQEIDAWRQSLLRLEMLEDGMITEKEALDPSTDPLHFWQPPEDSGDEDDAVTFRTSRENGTVGQNTSTDDLFLTPTNSGDALDEVNIDFDLEDDGQLRATKTDISVSQMRMQAMLMRCLWLSQEGCRDYWTTLVEPHLRNDTFIDLQKRAKKNEIVWDNSNTKLYDELAKWRETVGLELNCLPGFTISLDYLALVAWKRPATEFSLRRIRYDLPHVLEKYKKYRTQLLDIVLLVAMETGATLSCNMTYYRPTRQQARSQFSRYSASVAPMERIETRAYKFLVAGALGAALIGVAVDIVRQRGKR